MIFQIKLRRVHHGFDEGYSAFCQEVGLDENGFLSSRQSRVDPATQGILGWDKTYNEEETLKLLFGAAAAVLGMLVIDLREVFEGMPTLAPLSLPADADDISAALYASEIEGNFYFGLEPYTKNLGYMTP